MIGRFATIAFLLLFMSPDQEHPVISSSSSAFDQSFDSATSKLAAAGFEGNLEGPDLGANAHVDLPALVSTIRQSYPTTETSLGTSGVEYDVILQPGHYGRRSGATGTRGQLVSEQELVAYIVKEAAAKLRTLNNKVLVVSADQYRPDLKARVFLAIHADGAAQPCTTGPSLAYKSESSLLAMHAIGWSLATATGYDYRNFRKDNFTVNEAKYYMFGIVKAERLTGLLEVGELTCAATENKLITSASLIGDDLASALDLVSRTPSQ